MIEIYQLSTLLITHLFKFLTVNSHYNKTTSSHDWQDHEKQTIVCVHRDHIPLLVIIITNKCNL